MHYEYETVWIDIKITDSDIRKGVASKRITAQITSKLGEMDRAGWDFYQQMPFSVDVYGPSGCLSMILGRKNSVVDTFAGLTLIFRRPLK